MCEYPDKHKRVTCSSDISVMALPLQTASRLVGWEAEELVTEPEDAGSRPF